MNVSLEGQTSDSVTLTQDMLSQPQLAVSAIESGLKNLVLQKPLRSSTSNNLSLSHFKENSSLSKKVPLLSVIDGDLQRQSTESYTGNLSRRSSTLSTFHKTAIASHTTSIQSMANLKNLQENVMVAVVKIFLSRCAPIVYQPWRMVQSSSTGTGFVISNRRIITNYHVVSYPSLIRIKRRQIDKMFVAKRIAYSIETDLAVLTVDDEEFWKGITVLALGELPKLQNPVTVMGYPLSDDSICITTGIASRIQMRNFWRGNSFLVVQIDAAINSGNSGGPAVNNQNQIVGVAYEKITSDDVDNVGYIIAVDTLKRFLEDVERNGTYTGSYTYDFTYQDLQDTDIRRYYKMNEDESGVLVLGRNQQSDAYEILEEGDIVTAVDGVNISNSGNVVHSSGEHLPFHSIVVSKFVGDPLKLDIIRKNERMKISYRPLNILGPLLVPLTKENKPDYLIYAGFVFIVLTQWSLTGTFGSNFSVNAPTHLMDLWLYGTCEDVEEIVIIGDILSSQINMAYEFADNERLLSVNYEKIRSLKHLEYVLEKCEERFVRFGLHEGVVVIDHIRAKNENKAILDEHNIPCVSRFTPKEDDSDSDEDKT